MPNIIYSSDKNDIKNLTRENFFAGWPNKPSEEVLRKSIANATYAILAIDTKNNRLAGYITALSDDVLSAYIPFLEVDKNYQKQGIGRRLVEEMLKQLDHLYMIDLVCDKEMVGFYAKTGFKSWHAMIKRNSSHQSGVSFPHAHQKETS
jgi:ribosomal protein S18 acetylase RimI-like enzyme